MISTNAKLKTSKISNGVKKVELVDFDGSILKIEPVKLPVSFTNQRIRAFLF